MCSFFFFKQKTAYELRISYWSSDVCSSDLCSSLSIIYMHSSFAATSSFPPFSLFLSFPIKQGDVTNIFSLGTTLLLLFSGPQLRHAAPAYEIGRASCRERVCQYV